MNSLLLLESRNGKQPVLMLLGCWATKAAAGFVCERDDPGNLMAFKGRHERVWNQQCCLSKYDILLAFLCGKGVAGNSAKWPLNASNVIHQTFPNIRHKEIKRNEHDGLLRENWAAAVVNGNGKGKKKDFKQESNTFAFLKGCFLPQSQKTLPHLHLLVSGCQDLCR